MIRTSRRLGRREWLQIAPLTAEGCKQRPNAEGQRRLADQRPPRKGTAGANHDLDLLIPELA